MSQKKRTRFADFRKRLFRLGDEAPLSGFSKIVILILDVFVLSLLFSGLADHTRQLTSPEEYLPYEFRSAIIDQDWTKETKLDRLQQIVLYEYNHYSYEIDLLRQQQDLIQKHQLVETFFQKIETIESDSSLKALFIERQRLSTQQARLYEKLEQPNQHYQTTLLENISNASNSSEASPDALTKQLRLEQENVQNNLNSTTAEILGNPKVEEFFNFVISQQFGELRSDLVATYKSYQRWYPVRVFFWQMLFLLPLIAVFYFWNSKALKRNKQVQVLLSTHLLLVCSIPILIRLLDFVIELIPEYLFAKLFIWLQALKIIALWHYFVIALAILVATGLLVLVQKKVKSNKSANWNRVLLGNCFYCGKKLPQESLACPSCGKLVHEKCDHCGKPRLVGTPYCNQCGQTAKDD